MLSLKSGHYTKNDYMAWLQIVDYDLDRYTNCSNYGAKCNTCLFKKPCYELRLFRQYLVEKIN